MAGQAGTPTSSFLGCSPDAAHRCAGDPRRRATTGQAAANTAADFIAKRSTSGPLEQGVIERQIYGFS
jgi:hypothetical protein